MSDIDAIVKNLRLMETKGYGPVGFIRTCAEAATALESHRGRVEVLEKALKEIACFDDDAAGAYLKNHSSYARFDEPGSVEIARAALSPETKEPADTL
jgi:hypothetical protein